MVNSIRKKYEEYKEHRNIVLDNDEILLFYPDYYKTKIELENFKFITKEEADKFFNDNYKKSMLYKKLTYLDLSEAAIYNYMKYNKDEQYQSIKVLYESLNNSCISMCELIDYIGHYHLMVLNKQEKNSKMEDLMKKCDIIVSYYFNDDFDKMKITSDTVVRIIDKLLKNLEQLNIVKRNILSNNWLLTVNLTGKKREQLVSNLIQKIEQFPLSDYQQKENLNEKNGKNI